MLAKLNIRWTLLIAAYLLVINNAFSVTGAFYPSLGFESDTVPSDTSGTDSLKIGPKISDGAPEFPVKYFAQDSIQYNNAEQIVYLFGMAQVKYNTMEVSADIIIVDISRNEFHAFGKKDSTGAITQKVQFKDGDEAFQAPEMVYNFKSKKGRIIQVTTQEGESYLLADKAKMMANKDIFVATGKITTCDHENPHFYFESQKLKVIPGKKIVTGPTNLVINELRTPLWLPFGIFPTNQKKQSGILIPGQGVDNGQFGIKDLGFHWAINDYVHAEILTSLYFSGSRRMTLDLPYKVLYKYNGSLRFEYNSLVRGTKDISSYKRSTDYRVVWNFNQDNRAHPKSKFTTSIDFKSPTFNQTQNITADNAASSVQNRSISSMSWAWREKRWNLTLNSRLTQNFGLNTVEMSDAPSITFRQNTFNIGQIGITTSANFSNRVSRGDSTFFTKETFNQMRNGAKANVRINFGNNFKIPVPILRNFNISMPAWSGNIYGITEQNIKTSTENGLDLDTINTLKAAYDWTVTGFGVNTNIFGTFKFKEGMLIGGFRHKITPSATFSWTPDYFITDQNIMQLVYDSLNNRWAEYSKYQTAIYAPSASKQGRINLSLDNNLQMKLRERIDSTDYEYKKVNLINSFRINTAYNAIADSLKWSDLSMAINTNPGFLKRLNFTTVFSPYDIDETGAKYDSLLWKSGKIGRLTRFSLNADIELKRQQFLKWIYGIDKLPKDNFDWNFLLSYTYTYTKTALDPSYNQRIGASGSVTLSENWRIRYNFPVNIKTLDLSTSSSIGIVRQLHCWEFTLDWLPFSPNVNYTFIIRPKASILSDIKYQKRRI